MKAIIDAILINYKTWILYIICCTIICKDKSIASGFITFMYAYFTCYAGHRFMHMEKTYCNMYSISHYNHHVSDKLFGFVTNCITEFLLIMNNIALKYVLNTFDIINLFFVDEWVMCFLYIIYTTVHNINYAILKVNKYHFEHHKLESSNIGPDFFDLLFGTKNQKTIENEQIDHFIPNIILSFLSVLFLKHIYNHNYKFLCKIIFALLLFILTGVIFISSVYILKEQIDTILLEETENFV